MSTSPRQVPGYWTVTELAQAANLHENTIRQHITAGRLQGKCVALPKIWLIPDAAGEAFLHAHQLLLAARGAPR